MADLTGDPKQNSSEARLAEIVSSVQDIKNVHPTLVTIITQFTEQLTELDRTKPLDILKYSSHYWKLSAYRNALIKLRLIVEKNFTFIETLSLLATTRYVFEILVWLKTLDADERYALVFFHEVVRLNVQQVEEQQQKTMDEIRFFEQLANEEGKMIADAARLNRGGTFGRGIMDEVDRRARREFSIYLDQAKRNGYGFQAYRLRQQALPQIESQLKAAMREQAEIKSKSPPDVQKLLKIKWSWKNQAYKVGMQPQYDFIYSYTSRLLHATPASFFTDQKNLEPSEIRLFLEYVYVALLDAVELVEKVFRIKSVH